MQDLFAVWAIAHKDMRVWARQPTAVAATLLPALVLILVLYIGASAVGRNPVALVAQGSGPHTHELSSILEDSNAFVVHMMSADEAARALEQLQVAAIITIPADFDAKYDARQPDAVEIRVNNLNLDFTNDLRRSLPAAITEFYASHADSPIDVRVAETDLRQQDIDLVQFELVPDLVLLLTIAGVINAGMAAAREWEDQTIKELLLAPRSRMVVILGKLLAGWLTTLLIAAVIMAIGSISGYLRPSASAWLPTLLTIVLLALVSAGLGVAIGSLARRIQRVAAVSIPVALYLFFLSGGIGVVAFLPAWVQTIAHFIPTYYGMHALQMAIFYNSTEDLGRDLLVLLVTGAAMLALGVLSLRRGLAA